MGYSWDFGAVTLHPGVWLWGFLVTAGYSVTTIIAGLIIGVTCGTLMLSRHRLLISPINFFVQAFRCTPLLIQIIWFYYALPVAVNITIPAWLAAGLGLTFYMGAFSAEIFRGGLQSIERGQWQAARAIGMLPWQVMSRVILPQAARRMLPPFVNQSVLQIKNTSLLSVIAVPDLMYQAQLLVSETFRPLEVYTSLGVAYFAMLYPLQKLAKQLERRDDI
jgi:polar amino acid transport system permease protein